MSSEPITKSFLSVTNTEITSSPIDNNVIQALGEQLGHDITRRLVQEFLTYVPEQLAALQQGLITGDSDILRRKAHQLKGDSFQLGANQLGVLCEKLEFLAQGGHLETASATLAEIEIELARVITVLTQVSHND